METFEDETSESSKKNYTQRYSTKYRIIKTILLISAWISFGVNNEIIGSTYEDLKILLEVDYTRISNTVVIRLTGFMLMTCFAGVIYDKLSNYAELIMAISSLFHIIPNLLIPLTKIYWITCIWYFIQGIAIATYDLGGNHIILGLWKGVSTSPINAMHSGYGIGATIAVQIVKPYLRFDPFAKARKDELLRKQSSLAYFNLTDISNSGSLDANNTADVNQTTTERDLKPGDIELRIPYAIAFAIGLAVTIAFLLAQFLETKNSNKYFKSFHANLESLNKKLEKIEEEPANDDGETSNHKKKSFVQNILFGEKQFRDSALIYMLVQITLLFILFFSLTGYITVISRFMLTYLTLGPARLTVSDFLTIQSVYWLSFVAARFTAAFVAFKINSVLFFFSVLLANLIVCALFIIPPVTEVKYFFWIGMCLMGITSGPMQPTAFMAAKNILIDYNSFVMSIFAIGMGFGGIFFQQVIGIVLDKFVPNPAGWLGFKDPNPAYAIAYSFFLPSAFCFFFFLLIVAIFKKFVHLIRKT